MENEGLEDSHVIILDYTVSVLYVYLYYGVLTPYKYRVLYIAILAALAGVLSGNVPMSMCILHDPCCTEYSTYMLRIAGK